MNVRASCRRKRRTGTASSFGESSEIRLVLPEAYLRTPPKPLNPLGIEKKSQYRTTDVCALLGIGPDLIRYRVYTGRYPEFKRDTKGRLFSEDDLRLLVGL